MVEARHDIRLRRMRETLEDETVDDEAEDDEEEDEEEAPETSLSDLVNDAEPSTFDTTFQINRSEESFAVNEAPAIPRPWQGIPRIAIVYNLSYVWDDSNEEWVREKKSNLLDDFEDGDLDPILDDWSNWQRNGTNGTLDTTTNAIVGDVSGRWSLGSGTGEGVFTERTSDITVNQVVVQMATDGNLQDTEASSAKLKDAAGNPIANVRFRGNGEIQAGANNSVIGTWTVGTEYEVVIRIDPNARETYRASVRRRSDEVIVGEDESLRTFDTTDTLRVNIGIDNDTGPTKTVRFDQVEIGPAA